MSGSPRACALWSVALQGIRRRVPKISFGWMWYMHLGIPNWLHRGYLLTIKAGTLPRGHHSLGVGVVQADGVVLETPGAKEVEIRVVRAEKTLRRRSAELNRDDLPNRSHDTTLRCVSISGSRRGSGGNAQHGADCAQAGRTAIVTVRSVESTAARHAAPS
jgi:hypothetical protein